MVNLSTTFHPQTYGQARRTIQTLEVMLIDCVIDFKESLMIAYLSLSSLIIIVTIRAFKSLHMKLIMGEDGNLLLGGLKLVKQD